MSDRQITSADSLVQSLCTLDGTGGGSTGRISDGRSKQRSLNIIMGMAEGERLPMSIPNEHSKDLVFFDSFSEAIRGGMLNNNQFALY